MSLRIFLARHGETELNRLGVLQGRRDAPLTAGGIRDAERLGDWLRGAAADLETPRVWASPLPRARRTAELMLEAAGFETDVNIDERLIEVDGGSFEGLTRAEVTALRPSLNGHEILLLHAPDGEAWSAVRQRVLEWLAEREAEGGDHIVVAHAGSGRVLWGLFAGWDRIQTDAATLPHGAVLKLEA
jgi:broad specificity phosphatase PhoE